MRDSERGSSFSFDRSGRWRSLALDDAGRMLTATDAEGSDVFDLELRRQSRDGGEWTALETSEPS